METIISAFNFLKSPRAAGAILVFCGFCLFTPFETLQISQPKFVENYEAIITTMLFISISVLIIHLIEISFGLIRVVRANLRRRAQVAHIVESLDLDELCVVYYMATTRSKTLCGRYDRPTMISLRQKGALRLVEGTYSLLDFPHVLPDDIAVFVNKLGRELFPKNFIDSDGFEQELQRRVTQATRSSAW